MAKKTATSPRPSAPAIRLFDRAILEGAERFQTFFERLVEQRVRAFAVGVIHGLDLGTIDVTRCTTMAAYCTKILTNR